MAYSGAGAVARCVKGISPSSLMTWSSHGGRRTNCPNVCCVKVATIHCVVYKDAKEETLIASCVSVY